MDRSVLARKAPISSNIYLGVEFVCRPMLFMNEAWSRVTGKHLLSIMNK